MRQSQNCDHLNKLNFPPNLPFVFTEHGAVMLTSVINNVSPQSQEEELVSEERGKRIDK